MRQRLRFAGGCARRSLARRSAGRPPCGRARRLRPASSAVGPTRVASSIAAPSSAPSSRKATTVMLSRPPASFASATSRVTASSRSSVDGERPRDPVVLDHRRQPVGAEQEDVARAGAEGERVDLDLLLGAERPGDDRALRVVLGLLVGQPPLAAELLDQRVVRGQQAQLAVAPQVGAAVADVREGDLVALDDRRGERGAHARAAGVVLGEAVDALVGALGDRPQVGLRGLVRRARRARTTRRRSATRPRRPGRRPSRRRPRTAARCA